MTARVKAQGLSTEEAAAALGATSKNLQAVLDYKTTNPDPLFDMLIRIGKPVRVVIQ